MKLGLRRVSGVTLILILLTTVFYFLSWFKASVAAGTLAFFFELLGNLAMMFDDSADRDDADDVNRDETRRL